MRSNDPTFNSQYMRLKRREGKILRLEAKIQQMLDYIKKIGSRSRARKYRAQESAVRLKACKDENKSVLRFLRKPLEKRGINVMELMIRMLKTFHELTNQITYKEIYLLLYLYNVEYSSSVALEKELYLTRDMVGHLVKSTGHKGFLVSKRVGRGNYLYITEEGRRVIKSFLDLNTKQKAITI